MSDTVAAPVAAAMGFYSYFLGSIGLTIWNAIPWMASIFLLARLANVRCYVLKDAEVCRRIQRRVTYTSHVTDNGRGFGYAVGLWYLMEISKGYDDDVSVWMICLPSTFAALTTDARDLVAEGSAVAGGAETAIVPAAAGPVPPLEVWDRTGNYMDIWFRSRKIHGTWIPRPEQTTVIDRICGHFRANKRTVVYLHGPPGSGKSMVSLLVARELGGAYCDSFVPWQPGNRLGILYDIQEPTAERPLVVALDEIDVALLAIHAGIPNHKVVPIPVQNKNGWNSFFDQIDRGIFPHLLLILTSNRPPSFVDQLDSSYLREGRVHLKIAMTGDGGDKND